MASATRAPTPCTVVKSLNHSRSRAPPKPYRWIWSSRTCVTISRRAASPGGGRADNVRVEQKRSEEHTSELQSLMRISYAVFCLKKKRRINTKKNQRVTSQTKIKSKITRDMKS